MKTQNKPLTLVSAEPINDGGRKYNIVYYVCGGLMGIVFLFNGGIGAGIFGILLGLIVGWLIKNKILDIKSTSLRYVQFKVENKMEYTQLINQLISVLTPLGMTIERNNEAGGIPVILYQGIIYDIRYDENAPVFTIWWRVNVARAFFGVDYIKRYRKIAVAMGIIGYHIQHICNETQTQ